MSLLPVLITCSSLKPSRTFSGKAFVLFVLVFVFCFVVVLVYVSSSHHSKTLSLFYSLNFQWLLFTPLSPPPQPAPLTYLRICYDGLVVLSSIDFLWWANMLTKTQNFKITPAYHPIVLARLR